MCDEHNFLEDSFTCTPKISPLQNFLGWAFLEINRRGLKKYYPWWNTFEKLIGRGTLKITLTCQKLLKHLHSS